jgi:hypothetical protein
LSPGIHIKERIARNPGNKEMPSTMTPIFRLEAVLTSLPPCRTGQGVVEYAGALVMATLLVSAALIIVPPDFATLINDILQATKDFLIAQIS